MTDLQGKFANLETTLAAQNTAVLSALSGIQATLDAIATALGAPPPGGATLNDVITELNAIESTMASQFVDIYALLEQSNVLATTQAITLENIYFGQLDTQNIILATACPCDNDIPPLPAPPADFPQPEGGLYCQRIQYMLDQIQLELTDLTVAKGSGPVSSTTVNEILSERAGLNSVNAPSNATISGVVSGINSTSGNFLAGFVAVKTDLLFAIYEADTTGAAKEAYDTVLDGLEANYYSLLKNVGYQDWFNALYDETIIWPVESYSTGACEPVMIPLSSVNYNGYWYIVWPEEWPTESEGGHRIYLNLLEGQTLSVSGEHSQGQIAMINPNQNVPQNGDIVQAEGPTTHTAVRRPNNIGEINIFASLQ